MAYRDSPFQEIKVPLTWTAGAAALLALILAVTLFVTDRKDQAKASAQALGHTHIRAGFDGVIAPISGVLAAPMRWVTDGAGAIGDYFFAVSENHRLKKRLADLEQIQSTDIALRSLNRRYEELLKLRTEPPIPMVTGRVVADTRGPFANARLIDVGSNAGVKIGNPAMSEQGVVGRVVGVSPNASRLLLLTDPESRTPVLIDRTNARAVAAGDGGSNPRLDYVRGQDVIRNGDLVVTSGDGGLYPRGLPVGVAQRDVRGIWRLRLYSDRGGADFVRVLVYDDFSQMVDQAKLAESTMPPLGAADAAKLKAAETAPPPASVTPGGLPVAATPKAAGALAAVAAATVVAAKPAAPKIKLPAAKSVAAPAKAAPAKTAPVKAVRPANATAAKTATAGPLVSAAKPVTAKLSSPSPKAQVATTGAKIAKPAAKKSPAKKLPAQKPAKKPAKLKPGEYRRVHIRNGSDNLPQTRFRAPNDDGGGGA